MRLIPRTWSAPLLAHRDAGSISRQPPTGVVDAAGRTVPDAPAAPVMIVTCIFSAASYARSENHRLGLP
jgi:hypothetical protein